MFPLPPKFTLITQRKAEKTISFMFNKKTWRRILSHTWQITCNYQHGPFKLHKAYCYCTNYLSFLCVPKLSYLNGLCFGARFRVYVSVKKIWYKEYMSIDFVRFIVKEPIFFLIFFSIEMILFYQVYLSSYNFVVICEKKKRFAKKTRQTAWKPLIWLVVIFSREETREVQNEWWRWTYLITLTVISTSVNHKFSVAVSIWCLKKDK